MSSGPPADRRVSGPSRKPSDPNTEEDRPEKTCVDRVEVSTVVYLPPTEIFEFLVDFPRYARYSTYLERVDQHGDGGAGTEYDLQFAWWRLSYTVRSRVTEVDAPERIDWEVLGALAASGYWAVTPAPAEAPPERETASRVRFVAAFDPDSLTADLVDIPSLVSVDWVVDRVKPLIYEEVQNIVGRVVTDLEGESREITLTIHEKPSSV